MSSAAPQDLKSPITADDHVEGPADAPVTVVEYADFECLHCARANPILKQLRNEIPDAFRLVFRHFPIVADRPRSVAAARAAVAAGMQGRFWEMHDRLFEYQAHLHPEAYQLHAEDIGLDVERFNRDVDDPRVAARIQRDLDSGAASAVRGTPTFFINGVRYRDTWDLDALRRAILSAVVTVRPVATRPLSAGVIDPERVSL